MFITKLFDKNKINTSRQIEVDLARGFAALLIIICHVGLYLGSPNNTGLYTFSDIIGSETGAPIFMAVMGISIIYSRNQSPKSMAIRGLKLFLGGYLLSVFRTLIPMLVFGNINEWCELPAFFVVDILQLAGLSFLLFALFKKIKLPSWAILIISLIMVWIGQHVISMPEPLTTNEWAGYFINLFFPITEWSCFPFFTWFFFPAFGLFFGEILIRCKKKNVLYGILLSISLAGMLHVYLKFYLFYPYYTSYYYGNNFYYMGILNVLFASLFVTFALSFWHFAGKILPGFIKTFLTFLSKNLNVFYVISWIFVSILMHLSTLFAFELNTIATIIMMIVLTAICALITKLYTNIKKKK